MEARKPYKLQIAWVNATLLTVLHAVALYAFYLRFHGGIATKSVIFYKILGIVSTWGVTVGAHRLWSHKAFKANIIAETILMIMVSFTYQNSVYVWARDHRLHHKYSETDADPHNAKRGFFFSHVGWLMVRKHPDVKIKGKDIDMSDLKANPIVMFQHRHYYAIMIMTMLVIPIFIPWYFWHESLWYCFLGTVYKYIVTVNLTWCVNSVSHLWGMKPYDKRIGPVQNTIMQIIAMGEGFHNYHHTFPWDYKASEFGFDGRNTSTMIIDFFAKLGWVTERRIAPGSMIEMRKEKLGDGTDDKRPALFYTLMTVLFIIVL